MQRRRTAGFTLLELLLALGVMGTLLGIGAFAFAHLRGPLTLDQAAQQFAQDFQVARALSSGNDWRIEVAGAHGYVLQEDAGGSWASRTTRALPANESFVNVAAGDTLSFDTRGFGTFTLSGTPSDEVWLTDGNATMRIVPSMTGAVKTVKR